MPKQVFMGAPMRCSFGTAVAALNVFRIADGMKFSSHPGNIMDFRPFANIPTFGMCNSPANPLVIANSAAAMGSFVPAPCIPATVHPWTHWSSGPSQLMVENAPALDDSCSLHCNCGGTISFL